MESGTYARTMRVLLHHLSNCHIAHGISVRTVHALAETLSILLIPPEHEGRSIPSGLLPHPRRSGCLDPHPRQPRDHSIDVSSALSSWLSFHPETPESLFVTSL